MAAPETFTGSNIHWQVFSDFYYNPRIYEPGNCEDNVAELLRKLTPEDKKRCFVGKLWMDGSGGLTPNPNALREQELRKDLLPVVWGTHIILLDNCGKVVDLAADITLLGADLGFHLKALFRNQLVIPLVQQNLKIAFIDAIYYMTQNTEISRLQQIGKMFRVLDVINGVTQAHLAIST